MYFWRTWGVAGGGGGGWGGPGPPIKSALKGGWGCFEAALKRGGSGGRMGSGILESEFELYSVNCIAAKDPGCPKYM